MQINKELNVSLEKYDSNLIAAISNQVLKTVFTKNISKVKLKTKFMNNNSVVYKLETNDNDVYKLENNVLYVNRTKEEESKAKLSVYLLDNGSEVYVNSWDLVLLPSLDSETYKLQEMRYNNNKLSYFCGIMGILFMLFAAIVILNSANYTWQTLLFILLTIGMILVGFLAAEKTKTYRKQFAITMGVLGIICVILIFWYPLTLIVQYTRYEDAHNILATLPSDDPMYAHYNAILEDARQYLGQPIVASAVNRQAMLPSSGTFRGVMAIILLIIAAAFDLIGSFIGYVKSTKLDKYLESLKKE